MFAALQIAQGLKDAGSTTARVWWWDPTNGAWIDAGFIPNTAAQILTTPGTNSAGSNDWLLVLDGGTSSPSAAVVYVQGAAAVPQSPTSAVTVTYGQAQSAGDLNVVVVGWNDTTATVTSVTDTMGNVYAPAVGPTVQPGTGTQSIYYAGNIVAAGAGANAVRVGFSAAANYPDIRIVEYEGSTAAPRSTAGPGRAGTARRAAAAS